jgi:DNA-binding IclR family transcriptional regulator
MAGLTYVDEVTPAAVVTASWLGRSVPVHATSTGKAMLAFRPPEQVRRMLCGPLTAFTATTITDTRPWPRS